MFAGAEVGKDLSLYVISAEGGAPRRIYTGELDVRFPNWTSDARLIVFGESGSSSQILKILDTQTGQVANLPGSDGMIGPAVSPDGKYLAAATADRQKLMLFDFTTRQWTALAKTDVGALTWSRDGKYIYFDTGSNGDPALLRLRLADHRLERLASLKDFRRVVFGEFPWSGLSPDGSPLLMRDTGSQEVYALDFETL